jgi:hypothetical protein
VTFQNTKIYQSLLHPGTLKQCWENLQPPTTPTTPAMPMTSAMKEGVGNNISHMTA